MGLDMYAYTAARAGQQNDYYSDDGEYVDGEWKPKNGVPKPREIAYWRKHPNLHGWMERLWESKGQPGIDHSDPDPMNDGPMFNGIELELTWEDVDRLEQDLKSNKLPHTTGFFFGDPSDDYYYEHDLEFVKNAKAELFLGLKVFYNSSW